MKYIILATVLLTTSCAPYNLENSNIDVAKALCEPHGGLVFITINSTVDEDKEIQSILCGDKSSFSNETVMAQ